MKISIEGSLDEIAALALAVQGRQGKDVAGRSVANEIFFKLADGFSRGIASAIRDSGEAAD